MSCLSTDFDLQTARLVRFVPALPGDAAPRRPRLMIRAARAGQAQWRRPRDLARLMRLSAAPGRTQALAWLRAEEARLDDARRARAGDYRLDRHITVLIALLAELSAAPATGRTRPPALTGAGGAAILTFPGVSGRETARPERP